LTLRPAVAAVSLAALLAACAAPEPIVPGPATRFESGGGPVDMIDLEAANLPQLEGVWRGRYRLYDPVADSVKGPDAGVATLRVTETKGNLLRAVMSWDHAAGPMADQAMMGAATISGHVMMMNAHAMLHVQDDVEFVEMDLQLPDGRFYRHRLLRAEGG